MMKKSVLLFALLVAHGPGFAGWTLVQESHDGIVYVNRDDAEKTANGWKVESSADFHKVQRHGDHEYLSARIRYDVDCSVKKLRTLSIELHRENMAGGGTVHTVTKPGEWVAPEKGSSLEMIWSSLCR